MHMHHVVKYFNSQQWMLGTYAIRWKK